MPKNIELIGHRAKLKAKNREIHSRTKDEFQLGTVGLPDVNLKNAISLESESQISAVAGRRGIKANNILRALTWHSTGRTMALPVRVCR